jgi:hypothetical protein
MRALMADTHYEDDQGSTATSEGDLASIARCAVTCRYQAFVADMGTPVNITRSRPRWKLAYELTVRIGELAPTASEFILEVEGNAVSGGRPRCWNEGSEPDQAGHRQQ